MNARTTLAIICLASLTACSSASWYQGAKTSGEIECRKEPEGRYEECMRSYETTYQEYKQQREEAILVGEHLVAASPPHVGPAFGYPPHDTVERCCCC